MSIRIPLENYTFDHKPYGAQDHELLVWWRL